MKKMALLLTMVIALGCMPITAFGNDSTPFDSGDGSENDPYIITTAAQLKWLAERVNTEDAAYNNKSYKLCADIDLGVYGENYNNGKGWIPIGAFSYGSDTSFQGIFDGNNNTITGLYINDPSLYIAGLFGKISGGTVKKLALVDVNVKGYHYVGSLAGVISYSSEIKNCYTTGTVSGDTFVGGITGRASESMVSNCYSSVSVIGKDAVGGISGYLVGTTMSSIHDIKNCVALNSSIRSDMKVGRIEGRFLLGGHVDIVIKGRLSGNYSLDDMIITEDGVDKTIFYKGHDKEDGEDVNIETALTTVFWVDTMGWSEDVWDFEDGRLPILKEKVNSERVATPIFSPDDGMFTSSQTVTISCLTEGAEIYYTTNGAIPTRDSTLYTQPFIVTDTTTVLAIAVKEGLEDSYIASAMFTKSTPTPPPTNGSGGGGDNTTSYTVSFETNGGSSITSQSVVQNGKASKPADPTKEGYDFAGWYTDKELTIEYDFGKGVTGNITIYAKWTEMDAPPSGEPVTDPLDEVTVIPFGDVTPDDWYSDDVRYVYENGLMVGISEDTFAPNQALTRAMIITILYRQVGEPDAAQLENPFDDVADGQWYTNAIKWAAANDIVMGKGDGTFAPNAEIMRQDMAVMLMRYLDYINAEYTVTEEYRIFADEGEIAGYAKNAVQVLNKLGIINGKGGNVIDPQGKATRAEGAAMLHRFAELMLDLCSTPKMI